MPTETRPMPAAVAGSDLALRLTRVIKAPRARVFAAWTEPERMRIWFAPGNMTVSTIHSDFRVGGHYRIEMSGIMSNESEPSDAPPRVVAAHGVYREIIPNELVSYTWFGSWVPQNETLVTVTFRDVDGGTELALVHERFEDVQARDGHLKGWNSTLIKLASLCEA